MDTNVSTNKHHKQLYYKFIGKWKLANKKLWYDMIFLFLTLAFGLTFLYNNTVRCQHRSIT